MGVRRPAATVAGAPPPRRTDERRRLFGFSRDGTLFKLDFAARRQTGVVGNGDGGVFCLASLSAQGGAGGGGHLLAGCKDGTVKIYAACGEDGGPTASGTPELAATLPGAGGAILSLAWVPGREGGMGVSVIFAGVADGTIHRYDCTTAIATEPIGTGRVLVSLQRTEASGQRQRCGRWRPCRTEP